MYAFILCSKQQYCISDRGSGAVCVCRMRLRVSKSKNIEMRDVACQTPHMISDPWKVSWGRDKRDREVKTYPASQQIS